MGLRPELRPPILDEAKVARLASRLDGAYPGLWEEDLAEFNRLAGTDLPIDQFQGIYGAEEHEDWVRRLLYYHLTRPAANVSREELAEVIRRAMSPCKDYRQ